MLEEIRRTYTECAAAIKDFDFNPAVRNADITKLANGYVKAVDEGDEYMRSAYFSALMLRYWFAIGKYYESSKSAFTVEDCYEWLVHAITYALDHRSWLNKDSAMYNDPNAVDKIINRCIASTRLINYQASNTDKAKLNYTTNSLDSMINENGDCTYKDTDVMIEENHDASESAVQLLINEDKIVEAFILDGICKQDVFTEKSEKVKTAEHSYIDYDDEGNEVTVKTGGDILTKVSHQFSNKKLVKHLNNIGSDFILYFAREYEIETAKLAAGYNKLKALKGQKLYNYIAKTLIDLKDNADIKTMLCL